MGRLRLWQKFVKKMNWSWDGVLSVTETESLPALTELKEVAQNGIAGTVIYKGKADI